MSEINLISRTYPLEEENPALNDLKAGDVARPVLRFLPEEE